MEHMQIRMATIDDLDAITSVEADCFPPAEAATKEAMEKDLTDEMYEKAELHEEGGAWQMIFGVSTLSAYRRNGYAEKLIRYVINDARAQDRTGIVLTCKKRLKPFYESFGFTCLGQSQSTHGGALWYDMLLAF